MCTVYALERGLSSTYDIRPLKCKRHNDGMGIPRQVVGGPCKYGCRYCKQSFMVDLRRREESKEEGGPSSADPSVSRPDA